LFGALLSLQADAVPAENADANRESDRRYIPPLRFRALTRFYDPLLRATLKEDLFRSRVVSQAGLEPGHHVLDVGCGTATLTIMLKRACPGANVVGLDGDSATLAIARQKVLEAGVEIELREGMAFDPPFAPASFDRVVSSLVFHHLARDDKRRTLASLFKILRPGGSLHIADWGKAQNALMRVAFLGVQILDGFATTTDNVRGLLPRLIEEAGFRDVAETHRAMTLFGTLSLYRATRP
jgi:cyclopropane fatty-acyl-phospholipid synthase-like methyltransferase